MNPVLCPRSDCRVELPNPRIDFCACCGTVRPGSVRSQLLKDDAPRLICQHCSTDDQPMLVTPKQIGDHFPLYHKGALNVPDHCPNPLCQGKNPTMVPSGYGWFGNLVLSLGYWWLPLLAILYIAVFGWPESPDAALDQLAAAPWWHHPPVAPNGIAFLAAIAPAWKTFGLWALKAFGLYGLIGFSFWTCLTPRMQITRRLAGKFRHLLLTGRVIYVAFCLCFVLCMVLVPIAIFIPSVASALEVPGGFALIVLIAVYTGILLLIDITLPLLQLATFSVYGVEWERAARKLSQATEFIGGCINGNENGDGILPFWLTVMASVLLMKVYGFGWGLLYTAGLWVGIGLTILATYLAYYAAIGLLVGLAWLITLPFFYGWEKYQAWRDSRPRKLP